MRRQAVLRVELMCCSRSEPSGRNQKSPSLLQLLARDVDFPFLAPASPCQFATTISTSSRQTAKPAADSLNYSMPRKRGPRPAESSSVDRSFSNLSLNLQPRVEYAVFAVEEDDDDDRRPPPKRTPPPSGIQLKIAPFSAARIGVDPSCLAGKRLAQVHRSEKHPFYHLAFTDGSQYKIHLEDYEPGKALELAHTPGFGERIEPFLDADSEGRRADLMLIENCSFAVPKDKELRKRGLYRVTDHLALAFKVEGRWTCVWGTYRMPDEPPGRWPGKTLHTPFLVQLDWRGKEIPRAEDEGRDVYYPERWR
jgi:hypothetical protein